MMQANIRYSRIPKLAYGTKIPKYAYGYNDNTHQFDKTNGGADAIGGAAEGYLNSTPYYAAAVGASNIGKGFVKKKQTINPNTGEVTEGYATNEGYMADGAMTAHHTAMLNDAEKGDYAAAVMHSNGLTGTIYDALNAKNVRSDYRKKEAENEKAQADILAAEEKARQDFENKQRDMYSRAYLAENPEMGREGASIYAYGTSLNGMAIPKKAMGGNLNPIASNVDKAVGDTHEQGGITLQDSNGTPTAEIEDQELVVDNTKVLSDRLPFKGKTTFAQAGEKIAKEKSKYESQLKDGDLFARNGAKRSIENADKQMDTLFKYQDVIRKNLGLDASPVNNGVPQHYWGTDENGEQVWISDTPEGYKGFNNNYDNFGADKETKSANPRGRGYDSRSVTQGLQNAAPYLDNIVNYNLIKQTPKIPNPNERQAIDAMAMPLSTEYNINANLAANNQDVKEYNKNILDNTSNSNIARANIASGLSKKLEMNNSIYAQKINAENQLKNANAMNLQSVNNRNVANKQDINNTNLALKDKYNWDNMLREDDIRTQKSTLAAETTNDTLSLIQDKNRSELDTEKIFYDSLKHDDAAGFASLLGTPAMDKLMKDPKYKKAVYDSLTRAGQNKASKKAKELYGE